MRLFTRCLAFLVILLACTACPKKHKTEDAVLSVAPSSAITFSAVVEASEVQEITVSTNQPSWDVVSNRSWCVVTKDTENKKFTVTAVPNLTATVESSASITITAGSAQPVVISVKQKAAVQKHYKRVLFAYMAGDKNGLSGEVFNKIRKICEGYEQNDDTKIVIFLDAEVNSTTPRCQLREVDKGVANAWRVIREYGDTNSADPQTLTNAINEMRTLYPADKYGMLVFSHGTGWLPEGMFADPFMGSRGRSIIVDSGREMDLRDFAAAIPAGVFDNIVFEACLMAGAEVFYELRDKTDYIMASAAEILAESGGVGGFLNIYASSIGKLLQYPQANLVGFAQDYFNFVDSREGISRSGTISLIKTSEMGAVAAAVRAALAGSPDVGDILDIQHFDRDQLSNPANYINARLFFDLEDYVSRIGSPSQVDALHLAFDKAVVYRAATPRFELSIGYDINKHCGITSYIIQDKFPGLNAAYRKLKWYKDVYE